MLVAMRYADRYCRGEGAWRFADRLLRFFYYLPRPRSARARGCVLMAMLVPLTCPKALGRSGQRGVDGRRCALLISSCPLHFFG